MSSLSTFQEVRDCYSQWTLHLYTTVPNNKSHGILPGQDRNAETRDSNSCLTCRPGTSHQLLPVWQSVLFADTRKKHGCHLLGLWKNLFQPPVTMKGLHCTKDTSMISWGYLKGRRDSVVVLVSCEREIAGSSPPAGLNFLWPCTPRQGLYPHVHSLDPGVSEYLGRNVKAFVFLNSFQRSDSSKAVCSPVSWDGLWMNRSGNQGIFV